MIDYDGFLGIMDVKVARVDEVRAPSDDPLWIHTDLSKRLAAYPQLNWMGFVYDTDWGLLLICRVARSTYHGVIYPELDATSATVLLQYVATRYLETRSTYRLLTSGHRQVAMTHMNSSQLYVHRDTHIPRPPTSGDSLDEY
jgi:hypothetical protein